uniref:Uncharacterized protein n=1 Tax=Electrophorus electricus TaxID=8005 RepID=A0A4W4FI04_ELEEL
MAEVLLTPQNLVSCPVCLDLLKDPVAIPCGHSFCRNCINDCWDQEDQKGSYSCPQCRHTFTPRPDLNKNTMLAELADTLKKTKLQDAPPVDSCVGPGDVECDVCTGRKHKAVKSCLVCLLSFCEAHVQTHFKSPAYKKHKLVEASVNLQEKICPHHDKLLEIFCRTDQKCVCYLCVMDEHRSHKTVSATAERTEKQKQLVETQRKNQQRFQQREKDLKELKQIMESFRRSAQTSVEESERLLTELIHPLEQRRSELKELIRAQEKAELNHTEELVSNVEQEIADLRRRDAELEQLSHVDDHIHFLQSWGSLSIPPASADLPWSTIRPDFSIEELRNALSGVKEQVEMFCKLELATLDGNTAHKQVSVSEGNRGVTVIGQMQSCPDHPHRFDLVGSYWYISHGDNSTALYNEEFKDIEVAQWLRYLTCNWKVAGSSCRSWAPEQDPQVVNCFG